MAKKNNIKNIQVEYDGYIFTKDSKTGYYLSAKPIYNGKRIMLHRYIYIKHNGDIPQGHQIHHKDHNRDNNTIENLELLQEHEHLSYHSKKRIYDDKENQIKKFIERTNKKAAEWHKSEDGIEWHKKHYAISLGKNREKNIKKTCIVCGKEYFVENSFKDRSMFCSKKCKARNRRDNHIDDIEKECVVCGNKFIASKYSKVQTCSKECKIKLFRFNRCGIAYAD